VILVSTVSKIMICLTNVIKSNVVDFNIALYVFQVFEIEGILKAVTSV
jgi:hypothetical protein